MKTILRIWDTVFPPPNLLFDLGEVPVRAVGVLARYNHYEIINRKSEMKNAHPRNQ